MARKRIVSESRKKVIQDFLAEYQPKTAKELQEILKDLMADTVQSMLEAEIEDELGYSKYDYQNKETTNSRNGYYPKTITASDGEFVVDIPRDREGIFEPKVVKKYENDISSIEDKILSMYAKGMTTRDIQDHIKDIYGFDASPSLVSKITDKVLPIAQQWQGRPLQRLYALVYMDAIHFNVKQDNQVVKKAVYVAIGVKIDGTKEVLGLWVGANESSKYWLSVLTEIRNRGVEDILIISIDNLKGFSEAIQAVYPYTEIQKCIVHQIRNSTRFVSYKDLKSFTSDLKEVYKATTEEVALGNLDKFEEKWGKKYPGAIGSWRANWHELSSFFKYPPELRKLIYTTNSIENFNRQLRKVTKSKSIFPTDDALFKMLYLATIDICKKWEKGRHVQAWTQVASQLQQFFSERILPSDLQY